MILKEIDRIKGNAQVITAHQNGINSLFNAGIIDALRALGRPKRIKNGENHIQMASEANWSAGWNDCLDTLLYFESMYLQDTTQETAPAIRMDFGAVDRAVERGDITEEEANAIKQGTTPKYDPKSYTRNITIPDKPVTPNP